MKSRSDASCKVEALDPRTLLSAGFPDPTFGTPDPLFTSVGVGSGLFPGEFGVSERTALQADGKLLVSDNDNLARFNVDGSLDTRFGSYGRLVGASPAEIKGIAVQSDGRIVIVGVTNTAGEPQVFDVQRFLPDGEKDASFGANGSAVVQVLGDDAANCVAIQPDGKIVVGGAASNPDDPDPEARTRDDFALVRLTSAGAPDPTFGNAGVVVTPIATDSFGSRVESLALQPDGDILACGGPFLAVVARYRRDGSLDPNFGDGGVAEPAGGGEGHFDRVAIQQDGKILISGDSDALGSGVIRLTADGALDVSFGQGGVAHVNGAADAILVQSNGRIVVPGTTDLYNGPDENGFQPHFPAVTVTRLTPGGTPDPTFGSNGTFVTTLSGFAAGEDAALLPDGRIVIAAQQLLGDGGEARGTQPLSDVALARLTPDGHFDQTFGYRGAVDNANGITGIVRAIAIQPDGKILIAGSEVPPSNFSGDAPGATDAAVARYNADGSLDPTFASHGVFLIRMGDVAEFDAIAIQPDGKIVVGGTGEAGSGARASNRFLLVRLNADGSYDHGFNKTGVATLAFPGRHAQTMSGLALGPGNTIVVAGTADDAFAVARFLPSGKLDPTFAYKGTLSGHPLGQPSQAAAVAVQAGGAITVAGTIGSAMGMVRLTPSGKYDVTFGAGGVVTTPFATAGVPDVTQGQAMAIDAHGRIVLGGTVTVPQDPGSGDLPTTYAAVVRYLPSGSRDPSFGDGVQFVGGGNGTVLGALTVASDNKVVVGVGGDVFRLDDVGPDATFGIGGVAQGGVLDNTPLSPYVPISAVALQRDGKILAAGAFLFRLLGQ